MTSSCRQLQATRLGAARRQGTTLHLRAFAPAKQAATDGNCEHAKPPLLRNFVKIDSGSMRKVSQNIPGHDLRILTSSCIPSVAEFLQAPM